MSFLRKLNKLKKDPISFFADSSLLKRRDKKRENEEVNAGLQIAVPGKERDLCAPKSKITDGDLVNSQPMVIGAMKYDGKIKCNKKNKKVVNIRSGFSTLYVCRVDGFLVHKELISSILKQRDFIAFREKSLYVFDTGSDMKNGDGLYSEREIFTLFQDSPDLRSGLFNEFRTVIELNPTSIESILIKMTGPRIRLVYVVTSDKSMEFVLKYIKYIDVIIVSEDVEYREVGSIPREIIFSGEREMIDAIKSISIDNSYKKDGNLLLPIKSETNNFDLIDVYNERERIDGLIRISNTSRALRESKSLLDYIYEKNTIIEEMLLRESFYSMYKDEIFAINGNQKSLKDLLVRTMNDGVYYEGM